MTEPATTEVHDYADFSDEMLRTAHELFSSPTLDSLGNVDVNGITTDAEMRTSILSEAHVRALAMNAEAPVAAGLDARIASLRAEPTGRPFDYLTDRSLFETVERALDLPTSGLLLARDYLDALITECHVRALVLHERAMGVTYQCQACGEDVAILDQPSHDGPVCEAASDKELRNTVRYVARNR